MPGRALRIGLTAWMAAFAAAALPAAQDTPASLAGTAWRVVEIVGTAVPREGSSPGREAHLAFSADGRVSGSDGCNRLAGPFTTKGANGLSFGALVGTMMACPAVGDLPQRVRRALEGVSRFSIVDGRLQLLGATGKPILVLERRATEVRSSLLGTSWQLVSLKSADGQARKPDDPTKYTVAFSAGGRLMARLDCNRGRGTWSVTSGNRLELGPLAITRAMCPDGSLHDAMAAQWANVRTFAMKGTHLILLAAPDDTILEFAPLAAAPAAGPPGKPQ